MRKTVIAVLSAAFIGSGLFAVASYTATPATPSVEAAGISYSPPVNNKQSKRRQPPGQTPPGAPHPGHW